MRRVFNDRADRPKVARAATVGLTALLATLAPRDSHGEDVVLGYELAWGNLTLAEAEVSYRQSDSRYHLVSNGRTRGVIDVFFPWQGRAETEGLLHDEGRRPLVHEHEGTYNDETRWTRVDWDGDTPRTETRPPSDLSKVTPVPEDTIAGTSDPWTVLLTVLDNLAATGRCETEAKIWDGRRRYDITLTHLGEETLVADRPWSYDGEAIACALEYERIGGFWREKPDWRDDEDEDDSAQRVVWVAETAPEQWVLVRAEMETTYGTVVGRLLPPGGLESRRETQPSQNAALAD